MGAILSAKSKLQDNRELEARLRQADAAAAEARAARAGADAERIRVEREAQAALEEVRARAFTDSYPTVQKIRMLQPPRRRTSLSTWAGS